jgi:hypothetical protein
LLRTREFRQRQLLLPTPQVERMAARTSNRFMVAVLVIEGGLATGRRQNCIKRVGRLTHERGRRFAPIERGVNAWVGAARTGADRDEIFGVPPQ